jgi:hypothetical protein
MIFESFSSDISLGPPPVTTSARCVGLWPLVLEIHGYFRPRDEETVKFGLNDSSPNPSARKVATLVVHCKQIAITGDASLPHQTEAWWMSTRHGQREEQQEWIKHLWAKGWNGQ